MQLEKNMYVRTKLGFITKIENEITLVRYIGEIPDVEFSHNIIDLIEVGDYVNGLLVTRILEDNETNEKYINLYGSVSEWEEEDIKLIVTKEQFEQMQYKVGE